MIPSHSERNQRRTTPIKYLAIMTALVVASAALAVSDRLSRNKDESSVHPTALGDTRLHPTGIQKLPEELLAKPFVHFEGRPLYPQARRPQKWRSSRMERVGTSDNNLWAIYQQTDGKSPKILDPKLYYLKVAKNPENNGRDYFRALAFEPCATGTPEPAETREAE